MPPKSGCQKRKEKIKNDLELKKIRGSLDKFILLKTNPIVGDEKKNDNLVLITSTSSSSIPFVKLPAEEDNITNSNLSYTRNIDELKNNNDSTITELMTLNSPQKECSDIAMNDTDLPFSTKNENILLSSDSSENLNTISLLDPVHTLPIDRFCFKDQVLKGPYQPILDIYPSTIQGNKRRSFQKNWYTLYNWIEYSTKLDAVFCFPCRCFRGNESNNSQTTITFSKVGFKGWNKANEAFKKHKLSKCHVNSSTSLHNFLNEKSIDCVLDNAKEVSLSKKAEERIKNRQIMNRLIDIVICLCKGGRPFRGHNESSTSNNQGLFKEILNLLSKYDDLLKIHFQEGPKNALYRSNRIQNDIIISIHTVVLQKIISNINSSFISIMADETSDVGHHEQMSIVVRYFDDNVNRPIETFVSLKRMTSVTAESIFNTLCEFLILIKKNWKSVVAVCFDGASTMAGSINGVQMRCKEQNNEIMYVHCYAHCLNLTLIDAVCEKNSKKVVKNRLIFNFLGTIQYVHNYIESSPMRHSTLEKVAKETGITLLTLKSCSITRWACRAEAVKAIKNNYNVLLTAIDEICENTSVPEMRAKGIGILQQLQTFEFIFGMELMSPVLNIILKVSSMLQSPKIDLLIAAESVNTLKNTLLNMRNNEEEYKIIFSNTEKMCTMHKINNDLISGINSRFKQDTICLINAIANIINLNITTEIATILEKFAKISSDTLIAEIKLLKNSTDKNIPKGTTNESVFLWLDCIIPVTSCSCERVFSKLNIVKSKLRNTMAQDRLESLILLFTEQEMASNVEVDLVINEFSNLSNRRMLL
ncbi:zinc finger MYM-type protein 1-like [Metopolophium dirhodum]|uniref:zinc finger MYM-type protein 1-like n=1 Tax=Metopolophium dirhodum TaxID=44670 RepID=UPI00298F9ECE|nr:zinc finger MYM-type protein 1-like [Metopolophium dirhodum]